MYKFFSINIVLDLMNLRGDAPEFYVKHCVFSSILLLNTSAFHRCNLIVSRVHILAHLDTSGSTHFGTCFNKSSTTCII